MNKFILTFLFFLSAAQSFAQGGNSSLVSLVPAKLTLETGTLTLMATGLLPNPCTVNPRPVLTMIDADTLQIEFFAESRAEICIALIGYNFEIQITPKDIKREVINNGWDSNAVYDVVTTLGEYIATYNLSEVDLVEEMGRTRANVKHFPGEVVSTSFLFEN